MARAGPLNSSTGLEGVIEVRGILGAAVAEMGRRVVTGVWPVGDTIPKESLLIEELQVSRSVVREAIRILSAKGMVRSRTSDGTRVLPRNEWRLLDPDVINWRMLAGDIESLLNDLLNLRLVLEPGVVYAATLNRTPAQQARIQAAWEGKVRAKSEAEHPSSALTLVELRASFIEADLEFHRAFMMALDSELLLQLFSVIEAALEMLLDLQMKARGYVVEIVGMEESHERHSEVYQAYVQGDAMAAEQAMRRLLECAVKDAQAGFKLLR